MNRTGKMSVLPHEWIFGGFMVQMWLRLVVKAGPLDGDALFFLAAIAINISVVGFCHRQGTKGWWLVRLWFYPVLMNVVFANLKSSVPKVSPVKFDTLLAAADHALFGQTLSARMEVLVTPVLTELLSFCYLLFFPYILSSLCHYVRRGMPAFRQLMVGLFTIYGIGFLGYSLIPAGGPYLACAEEFTVPFTGGAVTKFNALVVAKGTNGVDVFPSLHCAVSFYLLCFDYWQSRRRFHLYLLPCVGIWVATIYLRYHYVADLLAGFALASLALLLTKRWAAEHSSKPIISS